MRKDGDAETTGKLPLHIQVSEMLAREIQAGIHPDGSKLAPERQMAGRLGISVGTLRKALADLTDKGLLERIQGSGNYVRNVADSHTIYGFFRLELIEGGGLPTAEVLSIQKCKMPDDAPSFGDSDFAFRMRRLRKLNNTNAALEEIWLDASRIDRIDKDDLPESLYLYYRQKLNIWISKAEDKVSVQPPPDWKPASFVSPHNHWGYVERLSIDQNQSIPEYSKTWFDPATTRFVARWS